MSITSSRTPSRAAAAARRVRAADSLAWRWQVAFQEILCSDVAIPPRSSPRKQTTLFHRRHPAFED
jgi:hypothetical protein